MKLKIADDLSLPMAAVTEVLGFLGRRGQGKSYAAQKLAELFHEAGAQFVALDPVGIWYGLRLAANGKDKGIPIPVFGGLHGDVPLEPGAGKMIADVVSDRGISAVLDVSHFESDADKARFATDFGARFYFRRKQAPAAVHLFLEECQEFVPQNPQREETRMLHVYQRMTKLGRNYGIGVSLISQRPQEVHKKVLNLTELLFAFQLTGPHERKAVALWIQEKGIDEDIDAELPKLKIGAPHAWSPAWLNISRVVHIGQKWTFDASSTPKGKAEAPRELAPIDLDKLRKDMAATIEKAKAEDPRELRKQIAELTKQIAQPATPTHVPSPKVIEKPILKDGQIARLEKIYERMLAEADKHGKAMAMLWDQQADEAKALLGVLRVVTNVPAPPPATVHQMPNRDTQAAPRQRVDRQVPVSSQGRRVAPVAATSRPTSLVSPSSNGDVSPARQKILNSLAFLHGIGVAPADKTQLALLTGVSPTSGGYFNNLGALRSFGLIDYPSGGTVALTEAGAAIASTEGVPSTTDELHDAIRAKLPPAKWKIVEELIRMYPKALHKDDLAAKIGVQPTSGGYFNNLGSLRSLGLIDYPQPGHAAAQPVLFLD